jgi:hypothetical protein
MDDDSDDEKTQTKPQVTAEPMVDLLDFGMSSASLP